MKIEFYEIKHKENFHIIITYLLSQLPKETRSFGLDEKVVSTRW